MVKLKLQYFGHLMWRTDSLAKTLMLGKTEAGGGGDDRGWDGWMASPTQWTWVWVNSGSWWWTGRPGMLQSTGSQRVGHDWATELNRLNTELCFSSGFWLVLLGKKSIFTIIFHFHLFEAFFCFMFFKNALYFPGCASVGGKGWRTKVTHPLGFLIQGFTFPSL